MEISKFVNITFVNYNNLYIVKLVVNHSVPTSLQWIFFTSELKNIITDLKNKNIKFGFLFDIKNLGMISLTYIKEFTEIMTSNSIVLEQNLYATSAIAEGVVIKYIFEDQLIKMYDLTFQFLKLLIIKIIFKFKNFK
jgi:hypothetical protein